jgi:hypothetical protein
MNRIARLALLLSFVSISVAVAWTFTPSTSSRNNAKVASGDNHGSLAAAGTKSDVGKLPAEKSERQHASGPATLTLLATPLMAAQSQATFRTDKEIYLPGERIVFTGTNWAPEEAVTIVISTGSSNVTPIQATADNAGAFTAEGTMPNPRAAGKPATSNKVNTSSDESDEEDRTFMATATGASSLARVDTEFTIGEADHDGERLLAQESYWILRQTYPTNEFNPAWVRRAAEQDARIKRGIPAGRKIDSRSMKDNPLALSPLGFTALGPQPERMTGCTGCFDYTTTAGRINDIRIDPTTTTNGSIVAYAASVGGGVWKTTNCCSSATTWTVKTDDPLVSTTNIDSLTIDPNNHNTIYAGTGDLNYGSFSMGSQGILKSTDGGESWTVVGSTVFGAALPVPVGQFPQYQAVGKVRVDPNDSNKVLAGTKTGLYLSYDGGTNWTGPCLTNSFASMRQDITGLELSNIGGITRIIAAVGVRGFATTVQFNLGENGANGIYKGTVPASGCPTDFTSIASNANGFVNGAQLTNIGSGTAYVNSTTGNQVGRIEIGVAPSNPNYIYAQVQAIKTTGQGSGCGGAAGCQLGVWATTDAGATWSFMTGSNGAALAECAGSGAGSAGAGSGDYPQNWYDQAVAVDPNNPDRIFVSTFDVFMATRTGTTFYDVTCGYSNVSPKPVHVDQHALAFVPGSSSMLLLGNDGGVHGTLNANAAVPATTRPTWFNMDTGFNTIEFYSGDISGNFATSESPSANGGAQDNGPSSVRFDGSPTGPAPWQMGLGGDGFYARIDPVGQGPTPSVGTITLVTGGALAGETFVIGGQTFTWQTGVRAGVGQVQISTSTTTGGNNIVAAVNADLAGTVTGARVGATVNITAATPGVAGNSIVFTEASTNMTMNGSGTLGGTTPGGIPNLRYWQGNNSGGVSRCLANCTSPGATWSSRRGAWTGDQQSFILPFEIFHGDTSNPANDCGAPGAQTGCGHLIAGTVRVWETLTGATTGTNTWYVNSPPNLTKGTLGNRSFINQLAFEPKDQNTIIVGTNDGAVQIGRGLGTGSNQSTWVDVTGGNTVLPNRPILDVAFDPTTTTAPIAYAAVGGFNENTPSQPGHVLRVVCTVNCASFTWTDKSGNLPNIPVDSIVANPNFPMQVFAGTDFGLYYTDDITAVSPVWTRFNAGLPNVMIWDMQIDRGNTTLSLWTRSRGAFAWPLPLGPLAPLPTSLTVDPATGTFGGTVNLSATLTSGGNGVAGKSIDFSLNGNSVGSAVTDSNGVAALANASLAGISGGLYPTGVGANFVGDSVYQGASATNALTVLEAPTITCPANFSVNHDPGSCSAIVNFTGEHAATATGYPVPTIAYSPASGTSFPVGTTTVTATATNSEGSDSCTFTVTVIDNEVPVVSQPTNSPNILWPPNHQMVNVTNNYTATDNCPGLNCVLTVTSNEPINGLGDGDAAPDWQVVDAHHVLLRAERGGRGNGRLYTITTTCTDASGNVVTRTSTVFVPPNQKGGPYTVFTAPNTFVSPKVSGVPAALSATQTTNPLIMGMINFDFSSKPETVKSSKVENKNENLVNFILGNLEFSALNYDFRALSGVRTQFKGYGQLNNETGYKYLLTVIDGQAPKGGGVDKFRIKIWNEKTGEVVFDNQVGDDDDADPTTPVGDGKSISFPR